MEKAGRYVRYLTVQEIRAFNESIILTQGGFVSAAGKPINASSLAYLVEAVAGRIGDEELYPTLHEKAAVYAYNIITRHVFADGNKRTAFISAIFFLRANGWSYSQSISADELVESALKIANREMDFAQTTEWFKHRFC